MQVRVQQDLLAVARVVPTREVAVDGPMLEQGPVHLPPHVRAMDRMVLLAREQLRVVAGHDGRQRHPGLGRELPVRVPGPVGPVEEVVDEGLVVALGPDPEPAHGVEEAAFRAGLVDRVAGAAVAEFDAGGVQVDGCLQGVDGDGKVDQGAEADQSE